MLQISQMFKPNYRYDNLICKLTCPLLREFDNYVSELVCFPLDVLVSEAQADCTGAFCRSERASRPKVGFRVFVIVVL